MIITEVEQNWWKVDKETIMVYTENTKKLKCGLDPIGYYFNNGQKRAFALQYRVDKDSDNQKDLFDELGLKEKNKVREKREANQDV